MGGDEEGPRCRGAEGALNNTQRDKSLPYKQAYNPADNELWVSRPQEQFDKNRMVILDVRNANQAAIDDLMGMINRTGWSGRVVWYP